MKIAIYTLLILTIIITVGAIPVGGQEMTAVFQTPTFAIINIVLFFILLKFIWKMRKNIWLFFSHLSIIFLMLGAAISYFTKIKTSVALPIGEQFIIQELPIDKNVKTSLRNPQDPDKMILPFALSVKSFQVEHFPADYGLFEQVDIVDKFGRKKKDYKFIKSYDAKSGEISKKDGEIFKFSTLFDADSQQWKYQDVIEGIGFVQLNKLRDKNYSAELKFFPDASDDESFFYEPLRVNKPVSYKNWKFYLMSYDQENQRYIQVVARKDFGSYFIIIGCWLIMISIAGLCFRKKEAKQ